MRENKTWDELEPGQSASIRRVCTANDLYVFAHASGNLNPLNLPGNGGATAESLAPSMWLGALVSAVLGNVLPGPGTRYRSQNFDFHDYARVGEELVVTVTVTAKEPDGVAVLSTVVRGADDRLIADGVAKVLAPARKQVLDEADLPELLLQRHQHFERLMAALGSARAMRTAVAAPEDPASLGGALLAARAALIEPVLVGERAKIEAALAELPVEERAGFEGLELVETAGHEESAVRAVALISEGRASALMKGSLHTDLLLHHVLKKEAGLRTGRRLSHAFVMDVPGMDHVLIVSDAAINIAPKLEQKVDITQNAIDVALALGIELPKVGILSAVETVNPAIPSTLDAAILSKMADRGQIRGGAVDGPLAMDNAVSMQAARTKGITSLVAGQADVLIVPNLEAGNMLAKELTFVAHAESAGIVVGARVPIILTSRADSPQDRLNSCAVAVLYHLW